MTVIVLVLVGWALCGAYVWTHRRRFDPGDGLTVSEQWLQAHRYGDRPANQVESH